MAKNKDDSGIEELLELLKERPELISAIVFDPGSIKQLLGKSAQGLLLGVAVKEFLDHIASGDAAPVGVCQKYTELLCPQTLFKPLCRKTSGHPIQPPIRRPRKG